MTQTIDYRKFLNDPDIIDFEPTLREIYAIRMAIQEDRELSGLSDVEYYADIRNDLKAHGFPSISK